MCYYNGQKVSKTEFLKLLQLEKAIKDFDFLNHELKAGFDYKTLQVPMCLRGFLINYVH